MKAIRATISRATRELQESFNITVVEKCFTETGGTHPAPVAAALKHLLVMLYKRSNIHGLQDVQILNNFTNKLFSMDMYLCNIASHVKTSIHLLHIQVSYQHCIFLWMDKCCVVPCQNVIQMY